MPKRALIEKRPWLLASMAAALAFYVLANQPLGDIYLAPVKGAAVGLLAVYAWHRDKSHDVHLIAVVMALGALGDMAMEFSEQVGALCFFAAHLAAMSLYLKNLRPKLTGSQRATATALLILTPVIAYLLSHRLDAALYALALGGMASTAWASRFSRYHVGIGAVLFVLSDFLIFARMGSAAFAPIAHWTVWPIYYAAQFLICTGVIQALRRDHQA